MIIIINLILSYSYTIQSKIGASLSNDNNNDTNQSFDSNSNS